MDRSFWNEPVETMAPSELRRVEAPLLAEQIAYVYATSPYYRQKFDQARVSPDAVTCVEALEAVPFTEKSDITSAQREGAMFGPHQCARFEDIVRIVGTGGTSGQPTRIGWTAGDTEVYNEMGARAFWANGCRPDDFVINCFNYSLYAGGIMDHMAFETLGAGILPTEWADPIGCSSCSPGFRGAVFLVPIRSMRRHPTPYVCTNLRRRGDLISNLSTFVKGSSRANRGCRSLDIARRSRRPGAWLPWICMEPRKWAYKVVNALTAAGSITGPADSWSLS